MPIVTIKITEEDRQVNTNQPVIGKETVLRVSFEDGEKLGLFLKGEDESKVYKIDELRLGK